MFVNNWQHRDRKLHVEVSNITSLSCRYRIMIHSIQFGGSNSGCHKLDSHSVELQALQWYHVAVYSGCTLRASFCFNSLLRVHLGPSFTALFVDGELVSSVEHSSTGDEPHRVQYSNPFLVGHYDIGQYAFYGNISHVAVLHGLHPTSEGEVSRRMI